MSPPEKDIDLLESVLRCLSLWESSVQDSGLAYIRLFGKEIHLLDIRREIANIPDEDIRTAVEYVYVRDMSTADAVQRGLKDDAREGLEFLMFRLEKLWS